MSVETLRYEQAVLSFALEDSEAFQVLVPALEPEDLVDPRHVSLWRAFKGFCANGDHRVSAAKLGALVDEGKVEAEDEYVQEFREWHLRQGSLPEAFGQLRRGFDGLIAALTDASRLRALNAGAGKVFSRGGIYQEVASQLITLLLDQQRDGLSGGFAPLELCIPEFGRRLAGWIEGKAEDVEPTGFRLLDEFLGGGLPRGDLAIIGGRPGSFKTAIGWQIAMTLPTESAKARPPGVWRSHPWK